MSLFLTGLVNLADKISADFLSLSKGQKSIKEKYKYTVSDENEGSNIVRIARTAAIKEINKQPLVKIAFDTRRINQEHDRNPRANLQYWHRSQEFIDDDDREKLEVYTKLMNSLEEIKKEYGTQPEYFESYARVLHESVGRILKVKQGELDVFKPQLAYLEQLLFARYRVTLDEITKFSEYDIKKVILKKDENLLKKGIYLDATTKKTSETPKVIYKDGNQISQDGLASIFAGFRQSGEKSCTRVITIQITDTANE